MSVIGSLHNNIINRFENLRPHFRRLHFDAVSEKKVSRAIVMDCTRSPVITPKAVCETRQICAQETFLSYLWTVCHYALWVHEHIQQRQIKKSWDGLIDFKDPSLSGCESLISWGLSLRQFHSEWSTDLPNPKTFGPVPQEQIGKTNAVYVDATVYILLHEFAHLVSGHCEFVARLRETAIHDSSSKKRLIAIEQEADNYARNALISASDDRSWIRTKGVAMLCAHLGMLLFPLRETGVVQTNHPDLDVRLYSALCHLPELDNETTYYHWHFVGFGMQVFFSLHRLETGGPHEFDTIEEFVRHYLELFDCLKSV